MPHVIILLVRLGMVGVGHLCCGLEGLTLASLLGLCETTSSCRPGDNGRQLTASPGTFHVGVCAAHNYFMQKRILGYQPAAQQTLALALDLQTRRS